MATVKITFETSGASFEDGYSEELARVLQRAADRLEAFGAHEPGHDYRGQLRDSNGNWIGSVILSGDEPSSDIGHNVRSETGSL